MRYNIIPINILNASLRIRYIECSDMSEKFRSLPSVDQVLSDSRVQNLVSIYSRKSVLDLIRNQLMKEREFISNGGMPTSPIVDGFIGLWDSTPGVEFHRPMKTFPRLVP